MQGHCFNHIFPIQAGVTTTRHSNTHAMQCILTRADLDLFYGDANSLANPGTGHHLTAEGGHGAAAGQVRVH